MAREKFAGKLKSGMSRLLIGDPVAAVANLRAVVRVVAKSNRTTLNESREDDL